MTGERQEAPPVTPLPEPETANLAGEHVDPLWAVASRVPSEVRALIVAEANLASAEVRYNIGRLALAFAIIMAGGIVFGVAGIALLGAVIAALAPYIGPVWSSLATAVFAFVVGGGLVAAGIVRMRDGPIAPHRALNNLRNHAESLKLVMPRDQPTEDISNEQR